MRQLICSNFEIYLMNTVINLIFCSLKHSFLAMLYLVSSNSRDYKNKATDNLDWFDGCFYILSQLPIQTFNCQNYPFYRGKNCIKYKSLNPMSMSCRCYHWGSEVYFCWAVLMCMMVFSYKVICGNLCNPELGCLLYLTSWVPERSGLCFYL